MDVVGWWERLWRIRRRSLMIPAFRSPVGGLHCTRNNTVNTIRRGGPLLLLFLALALSSSSAEAQSRTTSAVRGTVMTTMGTPVQGAIVRIRHQETGAERQVLTNVQGTYLILLLQPGGPYEVEIGSLGYAPFRREGLILQVGEVTTVDATLSEQAIQVEGVEVTARRDEIFNPNTVGPATLLSERVVEAVPLLSRDITELALLSPLVKTTESGGFSVAGQNDRYNAILIDGVLNKDMFGLTSGGVPGGQAGAKLIPLDAVTQYEVLVAPFDVRLSGFTGGVMNAVTRSGTNDFRIRAAAVGRHESLMGDLVLPTGPVAASGVDRSLVALSVGGPIKLNRAHYYIAGEFERRNRPPSGYNLFRDDPRLVRVSEEALTNMVDEFTGQFGGELGTAEVFPLSQQLSNVFGRLDWSFDNGSRLTVRNIFSHSENDESPNRSAFQPYEMSSNAVSRTSMSNSTSFQLFSPLGDNVANQLDIKVQRVTDRSMPASTMPQFEVDVLSSLPEGTFNRGVRFGGNYFAQENDLEQTSFSVVNSLDFTRDDDILTIGVQANYYDIGHTYLPGSGGEYFYASVTDLENNAPQRYQRSIISDGSDPRVSFGVMELGSFIQTQMNPGQGLSMRFGLRVDAPYVLGSPDTNYEILDYFGYDTGKMPSGNILISPRWGFNWQSGGERRWQVRMGAGMFSGQLPYVWLANAFHNDGQRSVTQICTGRVTDDPLSGNTAPPYVPGSTPTVCANGGFTQNRAAVVFPDNFKYPQDLKMALTVDRELSDGVSGSLGLIFSKALNQIGLRELNIEGGSPANSVYTELGGGQRRFYEALNPNLSQVLEVSNDGEDWAAAFSAELRGRVSDNLNFQLAYAMSRSWDRMSLQFADMQSNYGWTPVETDPNNPRLTKSVFDRPHKIVVSVFGRPFPGLPDTELSILYTGQSGLPFSYVYGFDVNGDGYPGNGAAFDRENDLVYVPTNPSQIPASLSTKGLLTAAMRTDECLQSEAGGIASRNACRAPWQNNLDLRLAHTVRTGGAEIRFEGDLINVLNMINGEWGRLESIRSVVPLFEANDCGGGFTNDCGNRLLRWGGAALPIRGDEGVTVADPWDVLSPDSQWQAQFGVRVTFGGAR